MDRFVRGGGTAAAYTDAQIAALAVPSAPYFTAGDPNNDIAPTEPGAMWFAMITEEMRNAIVEAGGTPNINNWNQLSGAVETIAQQEAIRFSAPPASPTAVTAAAGNNTVTMTWTAPRGGGEVDHYRIEYRIGGQTSDETPVIVPGDQTATRIHQLASANTYTLSGRLYAVNVAGARSQPVNFGPETVPSPSAFSPLGATTVPNSITVNRYGGRLSFQMNYTSNTRPANTTIAISLSNSTTGESLRLVSSGNTLSSPPTMLTNGVTYTTSALIYNSFGNRNAFNITGTIQPAVGQTQTQTFNTANATPSSGTANTHVGNTRSGVWNRYAVTDSTNTWIFEGRTVQGLVYDGLVKTLRFIVTGANDSFLREQFEGFYISINNGSSTIQFDFAGAHVVSGSGRTYLEWDRSSSPFAAVGSSNTVTIGYE